jgi:hypothetical protein
MAIARQAQSQGSQTRRRAPITQMGDLFIATKNPVRKLVDATVLALCDATESLRASREADADHDAYLQSVERLAVRGTQISAAQGCPCHVRYQSILSDVRAAQAADEIEDGLIVLALSITRRWSMALEKSLKMRKIRRQRGQKGER